jgi:hypothetical protein
MLKHTRRLTNGSPRKRHAVTRLGLVALVVLTSCTGTGEDPVVSASPHHELRWVNISQDGGGFGVPADWHSKAAGTKHFGGLVGATRPKITQNVLHADDDGLGGGVSYVRPERLRPDDAFVSLTFSVWLTGHETKNHLPNEVVAADFSDSVDKHLGVPVQEVDGWRNGDLSVRVRYWIGPGASEETKDELHMVLDRIELP